MFKMIGLDNLEKELKAAIRAVASLDGQVAKVEFDPNDKRSINSAVLAMERAIDQKVARYKSNPLVAQLVVGIKERYRASIMEQAAKARSSAR